MKFLLDLVILALVAVCSNLYAIGTDLSCQSGEGNRASVIGHTFGRLLLCLADNSGENECSQTVSYVERIRMEPSENGYCNYIGNKTKFIHLGEELYEVSLLANPEEPIIKVMTCKRVDPLGGC